MNKPHFAVVMPGIDGPGASATMFSLRDQLYKNWTLHLPKHCADTPAGANAVRYLGTERIRWVEGDVARVSAPPGSFALPLLPGDELLPEALAQFTLQARAEPAPQLIYSDHAEFFARSNSLTPFFKPSWSPEFLVATDYIGRAVLAMDRFNAAALRWRFDAVDLWGLWLDQSIDAELRTARVERVVMALAPLPDGELRPAQERGRKRVDEHLKKIGVTGRAMLADWAETLGALAYDLQFPDAGPKVSIIVPSRNNYKILKRCVDSLAETSYENFEIVIVDNDSDDRKTLEYLKSVDARVIRIPSPSTGFSYSYVNNAAVEHVDGEYLLFLNDDTEVIRPEWLSQMVGWGAFPGVASVGARLYYPDDLVQHNGLIHHLLDGVLPAPAFKLTRRRFIGVHGQNRTVRNYSAVTAACMLTPRALFVGEGGFNDTEFSVAYNDCDYGFRLTQRGMRHVCVPTAELYHYEGASRGRGRGNDKMLEETAFVRRYQAWEDPYYNANLSRDSFAFDPSPRTFVEPGLPVEKLSVALFSHNLNYEGAPLVLLDIARGLRRMGMDHVVVISLVDGPLRALYEGEGCQVVVRTDVGVYGTRSEEELARVLQSIVDELHVASVDVVIANTVICHWGMEAARQAGLPSLWLIHESEPPYSHLTPHGEHHVAVARRAFDEAYVNIFVAEATRGLYQPLARRKNLTVLYNGFDSEGAAAEISRFDREKTRAELGIGASDLVFLLPGTVCERKAQQDLVRAIAGMPETISSRCRFIIVGDRDSPYSRVLHHMATELSPRKRERLTILGETGDIWQYYNAADALVFTSHLESFPRVIQEAMYCGLPIISTPVFGISEQLRDKQSGLFYAPGDIEALIDRITTLARDEVLRSKLGNLARLSLERFPTLPEMQEKYVALVKEAFLSQRDAGRLPWLSDTTKDGSIWLNLVRGQ